MNKEYLNSIAESIQNYFFYCRIINKEQQRNFSAMNPVATEKAGKKHDKVRWNHAIANQYLVSEKSGEDKLNPWYGCILVGRKACLRKKQHWKVKKITTP